MLDSQNMLGLDASHIDFDSAHVPMHRQLVPVYLKLVSDAADAGFQLRAASGYRNFERQLHIWNGKLNGERPILNDDGQPIPADSLAPKERIFSILRWSALPGASRHHWGTEIDIYDKKALGAEPLQLTLAETTEGGPFYPMYRWLETYLKNNSDTFSRPYLQDCGGIACEPWHLSYIPLADECENYFDVDLLRKTVSESDMLMKDVVLDNFEEIVQRFVFNRGNNVARC